MVSKHTILSYIRYLSKNKYKSLSFLTKQPSRQKLNYKWFQNSTDSTTIQKQSSLSLRVGLSMFWDESIQRFKLLAMESSLNHQKVSSFEELNNGEGTNQSYCQSFFPGGFAAGGIRFFDGGRDREGAGSGYGLQGTQ